MIRRLAATLMIAALTAFGAGKTYEAAAPSPGANFAVAEFRAWLPEGVSQFRAALVLVPGSGGDGRPMAAEPQWQAFATKHGLAVIACRFTDRPHEFGFLEDYAAASRGSGQALLDALMDVAKQSAHPELAQAPLLLWGMSAGGQFNYEFTAWRPDRVAAFVVNKGGVYYSALVSRDARAVPGLFFLGAADLAFRNDILRGLFAVNRRADALWALVEEPGLAHVTGRSIELSLLYFEQLLPRRIDADGNLRPLLEEQGFIGELADRSYRPLGNSRAPGHPTSWLPDEKSAKAWRAVLLGQPLER